jgi:hypothetical protein
MKSNFFIGFLIGLLLSSFLWIGVLDHLGYL